jgi:ABC-2 type transport system ATP-binding protein
MKNSIRDWADRGAAVMVSSHLLSLVEDLCTSVLILHHGRMLLRGRLDELRRQAADEGRTESLEDMFLRLTEAPRPADEPSPLEL